MKKVNLMTSTPSWPLYYFPDEITPSPKPPPLYGFHKKPLQTHPYIGLAIEEVELITIVGARSCKIHH